MNNNIFDTPDRTGEFDSADIQNTSVICGISYIPPLFFLPLVVNSNSRFGKFHANQALLALLYSLHQVLLVRFCPLYSVFWEKFRLWAGYLV